MDVSVVSALMAIGSVHVGGIGVSCMCRYWSINDEQLRREWDQQRQTTNNGSFVRGLLSITVRVFLDGRRESTRQWLIGERDAESNQSTKGAP